MSDPINPDHYRTGGVETIDFIQYGGFSEFTLGNAVKYLARAGKKSSDPREDLRKAMWYIERAVKDNVCLSPVNRKRCPVNSVHEFCRIKQLTAGVTFALESLSGGLYHAALSQLRVELNLLDQRALEATLAQDI